MKKVVLDTETAGLEGGVCDIAILEVDDALEILGEYQSLVDPERPISPQASGIHHIVNSMVEDEPTLAEFMEMSAYPFQDDDLLLIGHNVQFDARMVAEHLPEGYRTVCTLKLARVLWPEMPDHKLQTLRYHFGLEAGEGDAHRAYGDAVLCLNFLRYIMSSRDMSLEEVIELAHAPLPLSTRMPFGQHKGTPLGDLPPSYVSWLLRLNDLDEELRIALQQRKPRT